MTRSPLFLIALGAITFSFSASATQDDAVSQTLAKISSEIDAHSTAYETLLELTTNHGLRLCASPQEARAQLWATKKLKELGADSVWLQPAQVPHWTRGKVARATIVNLAKTESLQITALGTSPGTPPQGLEAEVIEVKSLAEVEKLGKAVKGKIVFYNRPFDPNEPNAFKAYGGAVNQRARGPITAAKFGAKAVLVRSMTGLTDDDHPHAGGTQPPNLPAAAISTHGAKRLSELLATGRPVKVKLEFEAKLLANTESHNVVAELRGSELPNEYVVVGGHLDDWDLGVGAMDDGAGVVQSMEILRTFHALGIRPKRSIRVVLFTCEEFGGWGGKAYAENAKKNGEKHVLALESDNGGFMPRGFGLDTSAEAQKKVREWLPYLEPFHATELSTGESDTDVEPLTPLGATTVGLRVDPTHYFDFHHSSLDQMTAVNKEELLAGTKAMATLVYLSAQLGI